MLLTMRQAAAAVVNFEAEQPGHIRCCRRLRDEVFVRHQEDVRKCTAEEGAVDICRRCVHNHSRASPVGTQISNKQSAAEVGETAGTAAAGRRGGGPAAAQVEAEEAYVAG